MKISKIKNLPVSVEEMSKLEMQKVDGGKSLIEWVGYGTGYFIGLASWMGVGLSKS